MSDDPTVALLQYVAAGAMPADDWQPDTGAVLRRGRQLRARRAAATVVAAALAVVVAVGVPATVTGRLPVLPAGRTPAAQSARPVGDGPVAVLTDDIEAVNVPVETGDGGLAVKDVAGWQLQITPASGWHLWATWQGVDLDWQRETSSGGGGVTYRIDDDRPTSTVGDAATSAESPPDTWLVTGAVPAGLLDPVAFLSSAPGFDLGASGTVTTVELPTFRAPTGDRLLYAVVLRGDAARRLDGAQWQMTFVGSDGTVVIPGCADPATCAIEVLPYANLAEAQVARFAAKVTALPTPTVSPDAGATPAGAPNATAPAGTEPATPPTGGAPTPVELAPDVLATAGPIPGEGGLVSVGRFGGTLVRVGRDGADTDSTVGLSVISAQGGMGAEPRTTGVLGPWATVVYAAEDVAGERRWFAFGTTPPDLPSARVFVTAPAGFRLSDGSTADVLELPTFTMPPMDNNPIEASRPWFLAGFGGTALGSVQTDAGTAAVQVVFAGPDGTIADPRCDTECTDPGAAALYDSIRHLLLTAPTVATAS